MKFFIQVWPDETASLMSEMGQVLAKFASVYEALATCEDWYMNNKDESKYEISIQAA